MVYRNSLAHREDSSSSLIISVVSLTVGTETVVVRLVTVVVVEEFQLIMFVESMVVLYIEDFGVGRLAGSDHSAAICL